MSMTNRRKSLVVDARWLITGIGTYTFNLLRQIKTVDRSIYLRALTRVQHVDAVRPFCDEVLPIDVPIYTLREQLQVPWAARASSLLHVPHYNFPLLHPGPLLVTIADITQILDQRHRTRLKSRLYAQPMLRMAATRADRIFTVSEYSKRRIIEYLRADETKIVVAYNGVEPEFRPLNRQCAQAQTRSAFGVDGPYLLYVGNLKPHKNVSGLLRALALLRARNKLSHKLLIIGGDGLGRVALEKQANELGLARHTVVHWAVPQDALLNAYCGADLLVLPSFEEGFGLPVAEAMACGTPVACSRAASLPEIAAEAAVYFDPYNPEDIACAMARVLESNALQQELRRRGFARAQVFTWEESARRHCAVYREFLN